ncbi:GIY-YIG nuclease family protein [Gemella cuniculi]|uniref:GIY-YIG nuclease family protein n=1 Tax=Gemella cuniculi TaxID=150240 RepID=UPI00048A18B6|nr:GIY-YIG nuclease family protein [Gemella cuniculi]
MELTNNSYMYVLKCADNSLYTGYTTDLIRRIRLHNTKKGAKYTKSRVPVVLEYYEEFNSKSEAAKKEYFFKKFNRKQKIEYIFNNLSREKVEKIRDINKKIKEK